MNKLKNYWTYFAISFLLLSTMIGYILLKENEKPKSCNPRRQKSRRKSRGEILLVYNYILYLILLKAQFTNEVFLNRYRLYLHYVDVGFRHNQFTVFFLLLWVLGKSTMIFCVMLSVLEEKILYVEFFFIFSSKSDENVP